MSNATRSKVCTRCLLDKDPSEFGRDARMRDGFFSYCRGCASAGRAAWRAANRDRERETRSAWLAANPDYYKDWNGRNAHRNREYSKRYAEAHPEVNAEQSRRRRARERGAAVGDVDVDVLWTGLCALCAEVVDRNLSWPDPMSKSLDHIVPLARGGAHAQDNLQWAHLVCNMRKGARVA